MEYAYCITCENINGSDFKVSGLCYHDFENALKFISRRSDKPQPTINKMIWKSDVHIYKIISMTFDDKRN